MTATPESATSISPEPSTLTHSALSSMASIRERILTPTLKLACLFVFILAIVSFPANLQSRNWAMVILESASFVWLLISAYVFSIPYATRANGFLVILFAFGIYASVSNLPVIDSKVILAGLVIAAAVFRGNRMGIFTTILAATTVVLLGWISIANRTIISPDENTATLYSWIANSLVFILIVSLITSILIKLTNNIESEIKSRQANHIRLLKQIEEQNISLKKMSQDFIKSEETFVSTGLFIHDFVSDESPEGTLQKAVNRIRDQFNYYFVGGYVIDEKKEYAILKAAASNDNESYLQKNLRIKLSENSVTSYAYTHSEIRLSINVLEETSLKTMPLLPGTKSELALPLIYNNEVIGIIDIQIDQYAAFSPLELKVLKTYADQAAVSFQKSLFQQNLQKSQQELENSYQQYTQKSWRSHLKQGRQKVVVRFRQGHLEKETSQPVEALQAISQGKPVIVSNKTTPASGKPTSSVTIPIKLRNQAIGALHLKLETNQLPDDMLSVIETISDRLAVALENARLLEEIQAKANREHLVSEISSKIRSSPNVD
ncbi:MAG: GAF domain-containing protein, partial [Methanothrix sp.]|nr:GAF domain-containing protein [Methanothrix sp.]